VLPAGIAQTLLLTIVAVSILLMLVRPRNIPEVYWVSGGAVLLLVLGLIPPRAALRAVGKGSDVYLFLTGMMLLSELAREFGVFDWLASLAVRSARGSRARLFFLVYAVGTAVTVFMSNDATAVVLTPAILVAVRKIRVSPLPYLFACAFIANAASFVLPISNPANLVVFGSNLPSLGQWLMRFVFPSVLSIVATLLILQWVFRSELRGAIEQRIEASPLTRHGRMVVVGLALTVAGLLIASAFDRDLGLPTCLIAVVVAAIVCGLARKNPLPLLREISWSTLALVAGLFVLVEAVVGVGGLKYTQAWLEKAQGMGVAAGTFVTGICVGVANNVVNNLPLGLIAGSTLRATHASRLISSAVLIGVDVGPNLAITGSLATILWLIALRKERLDVSFWSFFKVGVIAMPVALLSSLAGALAMEWLMRNI